MRYILTTLVILFGVVANAQLQPADSQYFELENLLKNPSFEQGRVGHTVTGTGTILTGAVGTYPHGKSALQIALNTNGAILTSTAASTVGGQALVSGFVKSSITDLDFCSVVDGVEQNCARYGGDNVWRPLAIPTISGTTSIGYKLKTTSTSTGTVWVDRLYAGVPSNLKQQVSGARRVGGLKILNCAGAYSSTSGTYADYSVQTGCTYVADGSVEQPATMLPAIRLRNQQAGEYRIVAVGAAGYVGAANADCNYRLTDGTINSREENWSGSLAEVGSNVQEYSVNIPSLITDSTFRIQTKRNSGGGNCQTFATSTYPLQFDVYYYPPASSIYSAPAPQAAQIKFNNAVNCLPSTNSTSWTTLNDADCNNTTLIGGAMAPTVAGNLALKVFIPQGKYKAFFDGELQSAVASTSCHFSLYDGVNRYNVSGVKWNVSGFDETVSSSDEIIEVATATVKEFLLQARASSGSATCRAVLNTSYADANIRIGIIPISNTITGSFENVVTTPGVSAPKLFSAKVSTTGVVSDEFGDFINGDCTNASPTVCTFATPATVKANCWIGPQGNTTHVGQVVSTLTQVSYQYSTDAKYVTSVSCLME